MIGKHIDLFLVDGTPGALGTAEIIGRADHVVRGERVQQGDFLKRDESNRDSVYVVLGDYDIASTGAGAYVDQTKGITQRLGSNAANKGLWDWFVTITKDDTFAEGDWGCLGTLRVATAKGADRPTISNDTSPPGRELPKAGSCDMATVILQLQIVRPALNASLIRSAHTPLPGGAICRVTESPVFPLLGRWCGVDPCVQVIDGELAVVAGPIVVGSSTAFGRSSTRRAYANHRATHHQLIAQQAIEVEAGLGLVVRNDRFGSLSTGGAKALGRLCNLRRDWIDSSGISYGDWESREIAASVPSDGGSP